MKKKWGEPHNRPARIFFRIIIKTYLLDTVGNLLERVIYTRLLPIIECSDGPSARQFDFQAHSTIDTVHMVPKLARDVMSTKNAVIVAALDVKNAFNLASQERIKSSQAKTSVLSYLTNFLKSYLSEGTLWQDMDEGPKQVNRQGRSTTNLNVKLISLQKEGTIIGFTDELAVVVFAKQLEDLE